MDLYQVPSIGNSPPSSPGYVGLPYYPEICDGEYDFRQLLGDPLDTIPDPPELLELQLFHSGMFDLGESGPVCTTLPTDQERIEAEETARRIQENRGTRTVDLTRAMSIGEYQGSIGNAFAAINQRNHTSEAKALYIRSGLEDVLADGDEYTPSGGEYTFKKIKTRLARYTNTRDTSIFGAFLINDCDLYMSVTLAIAISIPTVLIVIPTTRSATGSIVVLQHSIEKCSTQNE